MNMDNITNISARFMAVSVPPNRLYITNFLIVILLKALNENVSTNIYISYISSLCKILQQFLN
jgi:hypothetical protein